MESGKPSNQLARGADIPPTTRNLVFLTHRRAGVCSVQWIGVRSCSHATDVCPAHWMCVWSYNRLWWPCSTSRNERQTVARNDHLMFQACEFGLPLQGLEIRFRIIRFSRRLRLLILSTT
jgi:hypothetical protein